MFDWLRNLINKARAKISKAGEARFSITGYYNGECPLCHAHIGTDVIKDKISGKTSALCGNCGQDVYSKLDPSKIKPCTPAG